MKKLVMVLIVGLYAVAFASTQVRDRDLEQAAINQNHDQIAELNIQAWECLQLMSDNERANAVIDIEPPSGVTRDVIWAANDIENIWNCGQYDTAIAQLRNLAAIITEGKIAIGISWRTPLANEDASLWGSDVRIGDRDSIYQTSMDIQRSTGTLFSILTFKEGGGYYFSVNRSTNSGQAWSETYNWYGGSDSIVSASSACLTNHCWVGYAFKNVPFDVRIRRFFTSTGQVDTFNNGDAYVTVFSGTSPDTIKEVSFCTNQDSLNNRIYCLALTSSGHIRYYWSDTTGVTWTERTNTIADAKCGLSASCNQGFNTYYLWFSYLSNTDSVKIYNISAASGIVYSLSARAGSSGSYTAISACKDTVLCAYDYSATYMGCRYQIYYNTGGWASGVISDSTTGSESPAVAARKNGGIGIVYRYYTSPRQERYIHRTYAWAIWPDPVQIANNEPYWNQPSLEYLGGGDYGVVYLSWATPAIRGAYFDHLASSDIEISQSLPCSYGLSQNYPNPFNASTCIKYNTPKSTNVKIEIYDILGRKVQTLIDQYQQAGQHSLIWNAGENSSGVYFARITADNESQMIRMMLLK
jgi:hypothetical protein